MFKHLLLFIFCFLSFLNICSASTPPFAGGPVTSPYLEAAHFGHVHMGVDIGIPEGTAIATPFKATVTHGAGAGYVYWVQMDFEDGSCLFIGDCGEDTLLFPTGPDIDEGTVVAVVGGAYEGPLGYSTGAHVHAEYHPWGHGNGFGDPAAFLMGLGVDLSGKIYGSAPDGGFGYDDIALPWGEDMMYKMGDSINSTIKDFVELVNSAFKILKTSCLYLLFVIAIIDFTLFMLRGMKFSPQKFIVKILKYAFLFYLMTNWDYLVNNFFLGFVKSSTSTYVGLGNSDIISANMSQPQLLFQKAVFLVQPALNKIASFHSMTFLRNLGMILPLYLFTFITIAIFLFLAFYVAMVYIEFYITAALTIVTIPFSALSYFKFLPEGTIGHLVTSTIKMVTVSIMVGFCVMLIQDFQPVQLAAKVNDTTGLTGDILSKYMWMCINIIVLALLTFKLPQSIAGRLGGSIDLPD